MGSIRRKARKDGKSSWEARITLKGHPEMSKSFGNKKAADDWITEQEAAIRGGGRVSRLGEKTLVRDALADYLAAHETVKKDGGRASSLAPGKRYAIGSVSHHLGAYTVDTLTRARIKSFLKLLSETVIPPPANKVKSHALYDGDRKRTYSASAVRKQFYALKTALEWHALEHGYSLGDKFVSIEPPPAWSEPRDRRLEEGEEERLMAATEGLYKDPEAWRLLIGLALETAMRAGELLGMRWKEVNEKSRFIVIPKEREKARRGRQVPLSTKALGIIAALRRRKSDDERVFHTVHESSVMLGRTFKRIAKRAECENLRFHDLRHEATARFFERTSLQTMEIALITGHSEMKTLQRYANLRPSILAEKLDGSLTLPAKSAAKRSIKAHTGK